MPDFGPCPLSAVIAQARWGDVLLFRCMTLPAAGLRALTLCNWDHVGVVVTDGDGELLLLEACFAGTVIFPLEHRLIEYRELYADQISWRRLRRDVAAADEPAILATMHQFMDSVEGLRATTPHDMPKMVLSRGDTTWLDGHSAGKPLAPCPPHPEAYWCSEIVAELYRRCGLVPSSVAAASCWPADLADGGKLQGWLAAAGCVQLEPERRVLFEADAEANAAASRKHQEMLTACAGAEGACCLARKL